MDREKVIKGLEMCSTALKNLDPSVNCHECPYKEKDMKDPYETNCDDLLKMDAIALLKEQEAVEPIPVHNSYRWFICGKCDCSITREDRFCPNCGRKVKWDG